MKNKKKNDDPVSDDRTLAKRQKHHNDPLAKAITEHSMVVYVPTLRKRPSTSLVRAQPVWPPISYSHLRTVETTVTTKVEHKCNDDKKNHRISTFIRTIQETIVADNEYGPVDRPPFQYIKQKESKTDKKKMPHSSGGNMSGVSNTVKATRKTASDSNETLNNKKKKRTKTTKSLLDCQYCGLKYSSVTDLFQHRRFNYCDTIIRCKCCALPILRSVFSHHLEKRCRNFISLVTEFRNAHPWSYLLTTGRVSAADLMPSSDCCDRLYKSLVLKDHTELQTICLTNYISVVSQALAEYTLHWNPGKYSNNKLEFYQQFPAPIFGRYINTDAIIESKSDYADDNVLTRRLELNSSLKNDVQWAFLRMLTTPSQSTSSKSWSSSPSSYSSYSDNNKETTTKTTTTSALSTSVLIHNFPTCTCSDSCVLRMLYEYENPRKLYEYEHHNVQCELPICEQVRIHPEPNQRLTLVGSSHGDDDTLGLHLLHTGFVCMRQSDMKRPKPDDSVSDILRHMSEPLVFESLSHYDDVSKSGLAVASAENYPIDGTDTDTSSLLLDKDLVANDNKYEQEVDAVSDHNGNDDDDDGDDRYDSEHREPPPETAVTAITADANKATWNAYVERDRIAVHKRYIASLNKRE